MTRRCLRTLRLCAFVAAVGLSAGALAHGSAPGGAAPPDAILIPSLTHGQMTVIAAHLPAIRALAAAQMPTDPVMRRLAAHESLQAFACLWGAVPGSLTDEASPFNECAHAYLAAARALLVHLREMPGPNRSAAEALVRTIETEMMANGASLTLCRYSDEPFDTARIVEPRWDRVPLHPASLATFAAPLLLAAGAAAWLRLRSGRTAQGSLKA